MDWKKAKNIIIVALLICNLVLLGYYLGDRWSAREDQTQLNANARIYAETLGIQVDCEFPRYTHRLPMLLIRYARGEGVGDESYQGIPLEWSGELKGFSPHVSSAYDVKMSIRSAGEAAVEMIAGWLAEGTAGTKRIQNVTLVYWFDANNRSALVQDTAFPCWCFETSDGKRYISALYNEE